MPDRWEKGHGLSTKRNDAKADPDKDGVTNIREFKLGTDPRKADTDGDGIEDGAEHAGKIASFTGRVLTINLFSGRTLPGFRNSFRNARFWIACARVRGRAIGEPSKIKSY